VDNNKVTSIRDELGRGANRLEIVKLLLEKLEFYYLELERHGPAGIMHEWKKNSDMIGREVSVIHGDSVHAGVAADINDDGSLVLRTGKGDVNVVSGDIRVRY
jgi:BirA family biotin operon repressor/biotin-[acetyl-CoA-carboxylase] ligase